jgi:uncharacterized protein
MTILDGQLLRFRTENHRSLRDEQELSFVASDVDDPRLLRPAGVDEALLPVVALYGANASGKSNVFDAISFAQRAVVLSQRSWEPDGGIARQPFALRASREAASQYVFDLIVNGVRYQYGFAMNDVSVVEEWLHSWPKGRKQELYTRDRSVFDFNRNLYGENRAIESLTRPNSLFLSAAAQNNHEHLRPLYEWFSTRLRVDPISWVLPPLMRATSGWWSQFAGDGQSEESTERREQVRALLTSADLGIEDFRVEEEKISQAPGPGSDSRAQVRRRISFAHKTAENPTNAWLEFGQESTGTQALVRLLPNVLQLLESGGLLVVDELNSLHPMLALALIRLFQDPKRNPNGTQLLFNTHDSSLLGNLLSDPPPLRRDQVWLTEKDKEGASHLYPLTDYKPRVAENLQRGYLQGRYGAVPFLGDFALTY